MADELTGMTVDEVLSSPENNEIMQALAAADEGDAVEAEVSAPESRRPEGERTVIEDVSIDDILAFGEPKEEATEAAEPEPEGEAAPDEYDAMLSHLNELAGTILGNQAAPPIAAPPEPVVAPVAATPAPAPASPVEVTDDLLYEISTDPVAHQNYMARYAEQVRLDVMREMGPAMISHAFEAFAAANFENDVVAKYPQLAAEAPNLLVVAYRKAREAMPNAPYAQLRDSIFTTLDSVVAKKDNIVKSGVRKDVRGAFAPKGGTRTARPNAAKPAPTDPTRTVLAEIAGLPLDSPDASRHLRAMGL